MLPSRCCRRRHRRRRHGGQEQAANQGQSAGERGRGGWRGRPRASGARGSVPPCARGRRSPVPRRGSAIIRPGCGSWGRGWARGRLSALVVLLGSVAAAAPVVFVREGQQNHRGCGFSKVLVIHSVWFSVRSLRIHSCHKARDDVTSVHNPFRIVGEVWYSGFLIPPWI